MPKSCFDGYLTDECATCLYWKDGNDPETMAIGCGCCFPIMECDAYAKMYKEMNIIDENVSNL